MRLPIVLGWVGMLAVGLAAANPPEQCHPVAEPSILVLDAAPGTLPKAFRTTHQTRARELAMSGLRLSGSGQFSKPQLQAMLSQLARPLVVVDLRQEAHGFADEHAISQYPSLNPMPRAQTAAVSAGNERAWLAQLQHQPSLQIHELWKPGQGKLGTCGQITLHAPQLQSEQALLAAFEVAYQRFYVRDHHRPDDATVTAFLAFWQALPKRTWLHFHCRGGKGRTTTFMSMVDILRNGHKLSLDQILARQAALGGSGLAQASPEPAKQWKQPAAKLRLQFLQQFYAFAAARRAQPTLTWLQFQSGS